MLNSSMLDSFAFVSMCSDYAQLAGWCTQACLCMKSKSEAFVPHVSSRRSVVMCCCG